MNITKFIKKIIHHYYSTDMNPIVYVIETKFAVIQFTYLIFISAIMFMPITSSASVKNAASCSYSDVSAAYSAASAGDTVTVPSGNCTWSSALNITKAITLQGAGSNTTVITSSMSSGSSLISITPASDAILTRVTNIGFQLGTLNNGRRAITINGKPNVSFIPTNIRIDHNAITGGGGNPGGIVTIGRVYGLIDHNTFTNIYSAIFGWGIGYDNQAWIDAYNAGGIKAGTADAMFVEDNTFILNDSAGTRITVDAQIYLQEGGASYVVRYNTFDASAVTNPNFMTLMYNNHGNQDYCLNYPSTCFRGMPIFESYNNTAKCAANNCEFESIRGGSVLIHDEAFSGGGGSLVKVSEEECWQTAFFSSLRTAWPAQDQVTNSFFWNLTFNGAPVTDINFGAENGSCSAIFIQKNRDYFMHAPQASGGKTSFTGTRYGGSKTAFTTGDVGSMTFSSAGSNAYYPYTPYTYPHPLTTLATVTLEAPSALRILN